MRWNPKDSIGPYEGVLICMRSYHWLAQRTRYFFAGNFAPTSNPERTCFPFRLRQHSDPLDRWVSATSGESPHLDPSNFASSKVQLTCRELKEASSSTSTQNSGENPMWGRATLFWLRRRRMSWKNYCILRLNLCPVWRKNQRCSCICWFRRSVQDRLATELKQLMEETPVSWTWGSTGLRHFFHETP